MEPLVHRRRDSDHPRRRLEDSSAHRRLLTLITVGIVVGAITLLIALSEARYARTARIEDIQDVRTITEQIRVAEEHSAQDMREHRIRAEQLHRRLCELIVSSHDGVSPGDCLPTLTHPPDPAQRGDTN
jgi:hypothetical protein